MRDPLLTVGSLAAGGGAVTAVLLEIEAVTFRGLVNDPAHAVPAPTLDVISALTFAIAYGLFALLAAGVWRHLSPPSLRSTAVAIVGGVGALVVAGSQVGILITGTDLRVVAAIGQLLIAVWLVDSNLEMSGRGLLSRGWVQFGVAFGIALAALPPIEWLNLQRQFLAVGFFVVLGFVVWQSKIGLILWRAAGAAAAPHRL